MAQRRAPMPADPGLAVEAEVRANVLAQQVGFGTVADLNLPSDFVVRVADRAIRESYYERHRSVAGILPQLDPTSLATAAGPWALLQERTPALASFRSPELDGVDVAAARLSGHLPADAAHHWELEPRRIVRQRLAKDGLLVTVARVVLHLGPQSFTPCSEAQVERLARVGVPTDLLPLFRLEGVEPGPISMVEHIANALLDGTRIEKVEKLLRRAKFTPVQTIHGFRPSSESGLDQPRKVRLQLARDQYFAGPGDGGALDLTEGVLRQFRDCAFSIAVWKGHAAKAHSLARMAGNERRASVCVHDMPMSQWAGDNAKPGSVLNADGVRAPAQLAPRYAARREDAPIFMPGDDFAVTQDADAGVVSMRSPWLFQGGNLLVCDDLQRKDRVLLVGEAEVYRNVALGLTKEQVHLALSTEFAVDRCVVLPAASYHIDQEVAVLSVAEGKPIAFIPDTRAGARIILRTCLQRLGEVGRWPEEVIREALSALEESRLRECLTLTWEMLARERGADGLWTENFAQLLSVGPVDSGPGNLHRFLSATDHLAAEAADSSEFEDGHFKAVIRSFIRREQDRRSLRSRLEGMGWSVVAVPAFLEDSRGVNPLNGVFEHRTWVMPTYGGLLGVLDREALNAFQRAMEAHGMGVSTLNSGESQRRQGALHCALSVFGW